MSFSGRSSDVAVLGHSAGRFQVDWQEVVDALATIVAGCGIALISRPLAATPSAETLTLQAGMPQHMMETYKAAPWTGCAWHTARQANRVGVPFSTARDITADKLEATRYYREILNAHGFGGEVGVKLREDAGRHVVLTIACPTGCDPAVMVQYAELLEALAPDLSRAIDTSVALRMSAFTGALDTLEEMAVAAAIFDNRGALIAMNPIARRSLIDTSALEQGLNSIVRFSTTKETKQFQDIMAGKSKTRSMGFTVPNQVGPNIFECFSLPSTGRFHSRSARTCGFLPNEPWKLGVFRCREGLLHPEAVELQALGVSPAESVALEALLRGLTAEEHAAERGIDAVTIRWHHRNIFERLACAGRAELIRVVVSLLRPRKKLV